MQIGSTSFSVGPRSTALDDIAKSVDSGAIKSDKFIKASGGQKVYTSGVRGAIDNFLAKHGNRKAQERQNVARELGAKMVERLIDGKFGQGVGKKVLDALTFSPNAQTHGFRNTDFSKGIMAGEVKMLMEVAGRIADGGSYRKPESNGFSLPQDHKKITIPDLPHMNIGNEDQKQLSGSSNNVPLINIPSLSQQEISNNSSTGSESNISFEHDNIHEQNLAFILKEMPSSIEETSIDDQNLDMVLNFIEENATEPSDDLSKVINEVELALSEDIDIPVKTDVNFDHIIYGNEKDDVGEDLLGDLLSDIANSKPKPSTHPLSEVPKDIEVTGSEIDDLVADLMGETNKNDISLGKSEKKEYLDLYEPEPFEDEPRKVVASGLTESEIISLSDILDEIHNNNKG